MNLEEALRHAIDGQAVLFVGAGFSSSAKNRTGSTLPTGRELATVLATELKIGTTPQLDIVSDMYKDRLGEFKLAEFAA